MSFIAHMVAQNVSAWRVVKALLGSETANKLTNSLPWNSPYHSLTILHPTSCLAFAFVCSDL